ncbi:MAG: patatin [Anaerolineae bacterium]|nr:patatin [Anaerolineae bacterium]
MSAMTIKRTALVLSGGGAKGAFQVGAERYAREQCGYDWDVIAGVSVGALNAAMIAMEKYERLWGIWQQLSQKNVMRGRINAWSFAQMIFGRQSFSNNEPLWQLIQGELDPAAIVKDLRVGAVSLINGDYVRFTREHPDLARAILASTAMPVVWEPVHISKEHMHMVDGALRNISPLKDIVDAEPDEIVIINCNRPGIVPLAQPPRSGFGIAMRTLEIMFNEIFREDVDDFLRMNALVQQAELCGARLQRKDGSAYRNIPVRVIEPAAPFRRLTGLYTSNDSTVH